MLGGIPVHTKYQYLFSTRSWRCFRWDPLHCCTAKRHAWMKRFGAKAKMGSLKEVLETDNEETVPKRGGVSAYWRNFALSLTWIRHLFTRNVVAVLSFRSASDFSANCLVVLVVVATTDAEIRRLCSCRHKGPFVCFFRLLLFSIADQTRGVSRVTCKENVSHKLVVLWMLCAFIDNVVHRSKKISFLVNVGAENTYLAFISHISWISIIKTWSQRSSIQTPRHCRKITSRLSPLMIWTNRSEHTLISRHKGMGTQSDQLVSIKIYG